MQDRERNDLRMVLVYVLNQEDSFLRSSTKKLITLKK